jgi:adenylate cyclase
MSSAAPDQVREQLARMLASRSFAHAERLRKFLRFVVHAALDGSGSAPKEYVIAVEVCGRPADFDPAADPIVRVDATRLRSRLAAYYADEGRDDPVEISLPKGSYEPRFALRNAAPAETDAVASQPSLAVLPFVNLRADTETDFFSDGLTEELINLLSRMQGLRVVARTSVFQFKGRAIDVRDIGRALAVSHVLEGSVREADGRLRVTAQLTDARSGWLLWSDKFERTLTEVFAIQDEICASLAAALRVRLVEGAARADRTDDPEAHRWYLRGRHFWNRRTADALDRSTACYRAALDRDPAYALPYCGLADSLAVQALNEHADAASVMPQARAYAARARQLGPHLPEPLVSTAFIKCVWEWDWDSAERDFRQAIALSPGADIAHYLYAIVNLAPRARWSDALRSMQTALDLDPISPVLRRDRGVIGYLQRDFAGAEADFRAACELDPAFVGHLFWLARTLTELGRFEEADAALAARTSAHANTRVLAARAHTHVGLGQQSLADACVSELQTLVQRGKAPAANLAMALIGVGRLDAALERLADAVNSRAVSLFQLAVDPIYDPLRDDPRFDVLLRQMRLDDVPRHPRG